jgi:2-oxoglutarate ferredoxin oxidoreductase subunit gamma
MNRPSLDKFEQSVIPGGLLIMDSDLINREPERNDIDVIKINAESIAEEVGSKKIANMVLLGALVERTGIVPMEALLKALKEHGKEQFYELNKKALEKGQELAKR